VAGIVVLMGTLSCTQQGPQSASSNDLGSSVPGSTNPASNDPGPSDSGTTTDSGASDLGSAVEGAITMEFFGLNLLENVANPGQLPSVPFGAVGHPVRLVWPAIEKSTTFGQCGMGSTSGDQANYNWSFYDSQVNKAAAANVPIYVSFGQTPACAVANQSTCDTKGACTAPPDSIDAGLADLKAAVTAFATRYKGKVKYVDPCNECNGMGFWTGTPAQAAAYAAAIHDAYKAVDPNAVLLTASTSGSLTEATAWLTSYLQAGGATVAEACNAHGYPGVFGPNHYAAWPEVETPKGAILTRLNTIRDTCTTAGVPHKIVMTEGSWLLNAMLPDPEQQAAWLARYLILQAMAQSVTGELALSWFIWGTANSGTISDSSNNATSAGVAFGQMTSWLVGATPQPCSANGAIWTCSLTRPGGYQGLILWDTSQPCSSMGGCAGAPYPAPAGFIKVRDIAGVAATIGGSVNVGAKPILLENQ
jgi:hypothetical protein